MKNHSRRLISTALMVALTTIPPQAFVYAEDTDLFVGNPQGGVQQPNVLIIIDSSDNWAAQNQNWPGGEFQGQAELSALKDVIDLLPTENIGVGLMLMTPGTGSGAKDGGYVRFAIRKMDATGKGALKEMIGDADCPDGPNSLAAPSPLTEPRNCIYKNAASGTLKEGAGSNVDYGNAMFEAFKYFGGYSRPNITGAGTPVVTTVPSDGFGPYRYAGDLPSVQKPLGGDGRDDPAAFNPGNQRTTYNPPINETNNCAKNYIIFVGNGFPNQNNSGPVLANVNNGDTTQFEMAAFTGTNPTASMGLSGNTCRTQNQCASDITAAEKAPFIAQGYDTFTCQFKQGTTDATGCSGQSRKNWEKIATDTDITVATPTGGTVTPPTASVPIRYADEWAWFLANTDVSPATGKQSVQTYTIDVFHDKQDKDQTTLLFSMAKLGQGKYFQATDKDAIKDAFTKIFAEILAENSVFAATSLPVSATNRAQNENQVFFGLFRPDKDALPRWYGNLKRYQIAKDSTGSLILADKLGQNAVDAASGFFDSCAASFWTEDSGAYWQFAGLATKCPAGRRPAGSTSEYSDLPDGEQVEKGGAAHVLRSGNVASARVMKTCADETCSAMVDIAQIDGSGTVSSPAITPERFGLAASDTSTRDKIILYTYGRDVGLLSGDPAVVGEKIPAGSATATRPSVHGDVVHSRPLPVNYGASGGIVAYYGTNDGLFRAVQTSDGKELWSFVAPEQHSKLPRLRNNSAAITYPGTPDATALPKDYFFDGTIGLFQNADNSKVMIFPAMRRGGRMFYGFNVTTPTSPALMWRVGCPNLGDNTGCTADFADGSIGQTWSTPSVAFIKGFSDPNPGGTPDPNAIPVIVVGGGYDTCDDTDNKTTTCPNNSTAKGSKVYVLNANTGAVVATFPTNRSVAADVALLERNFDGAVDHAFAVDTGGNVYRIDFVNPLTLAPLPPPGGGAGATCGATPSAWCITKIASVGSGSGKKFLFPPSVLPIRSGGQDMAIITLGSGDRERPLVANYPVNAAKGGSVRNSFYTFIDRYSGGPLDLDAGTADASTVVPVDLLAGRCLPEVRGWRVDLTAGTGEQTVTGSLITGGRVFWNTHTATSPEAGQCNSLGDARGYNRDLFCGGGFYVDYTQSTLPITPVQGTTTLADGSVVTFCIGCATTPGTTNPYTPGEIKPVIVPVRSRLYWYRQGDK